MKDEEVVTTEDVLYGNQAGYLYKVLYVQEEKYPVLQYLKDHFYSKRRWNESAKWKERSKENGKFLVRIFYRNPEGKQATALYSFEKKSDSQRFIRWCEEVGIHSGIE